MPYKNKNSPEAKASLARRTKKWREAHPEKWAAISKKTARTRYYKYEHGISEAEFEAQIAAQNNLCPIGNHPFGERGKKNDSPCQDHDHETGKNRAVLCRRHNVGIGYFNESIAELESAISYLNGYKKF